MSTSFLPTIRELVRCYQAFETLSGTHIRTLNLTPPQFDIIATLGNTEGMRFKELGEKTLCTKGTLTGIVDRLSDKGLVQRIASPSDGRSQIVQLTAAGEKLFAEIFPAHLAYMDDVLRDFDTDCMQRIQQDLHALRSHIAKKGSA